MRRLDATPRELDARLRSGVAGAADLVSEDAFRQSSERGFQTRSGNKTPGGDDFAPLDQVRRRPELRNRLVAGRDLLARFDVTADEPPLRRKSPAWRTVIGTMVRFDASADAESVPAAAAKRWILPSLDERVGEWRAMRSTGTTAGLTRSPVALVTPQDAQAAARLGDGIDGVLETGDGPGSSRSYLAEVSLDEASRPDEAPPIPAAAELLRKTEDPWKNRP